MCMSDTGNQNRLKQGHDGSIGGKESSLTPSLSDTEAGCLGRVCESERVGVGRAPRHCGPTSVAGGTIDNGRRTSISRVILRELVALGSNH